jgi:rhomboid protease GluP
MALSVDESQLSQLLRAIAATDPQPWYPAQFAQQQQVDRNSLDAPLNELRFGGFVRLTDWQPNVGQGYLLTTEGRKALNRPRLLTPAATPQPPTAATPSRATADVPVTRALVALQAGVFVLGLLQVIEQGKPPNLYLTNGDSDLTRQLAVSRAAVAGGAWWTLWSYALVHAGLPHLGLNLFGHLFDARIAELMYGKWRFIVIYLLAVFAGGVGAVLATPNKLTVGSSGGLCGVLAAQLIFVITQRHRFDPETRQKQMRDLFRAGILITAISLVPGISWGGHLGGALGGGLAAWLALFVTAANPAVRWSSRAAWILFPLLTFWGLWSWLH